MSALFENIGTRYAEYMTRQGRYQARGVLLSQGNAVLEDLGISRELLESGVSAWPWKLVVDQPVPVVTTQQFSWGERRRAIRELRALSNKELQDIGISRDSIVDAVKNGRPGAAYPEVRAADWSTLANDAIGTASDDFDSTAANTPLQSTVAA